MLKASIFLFFLLTLNFSVSAKSLDLIYGDDDRYEVDSYSNQFFIEKARSVAMRVPNNFLDQDRNDAELINFPKKKLNRVIPLICPTEKFTEQISLGECSGFLVGRNKLLTAGHCMIDQSICANNKWVFDFKEGTTQFHKNNIYACKKIISQKYIYSKNTVSDFSLIELDRDVTDREPLALRTQGHVKVNTPLVVIGHPLGLPMKITDGGKVSNMNDKGPSNKILSWILRRNYFTTNLDTYSGNSGSPVFNAITGLVEGIIIQGQDDFVFDKEKRCLKSVQLSDSPLKSYEKVMRIRKIEGI